MYKVVYSFVYLSNKVFSFGLYLLYKGFILLFRVVDHTLILSQECFLKHVEVFHDWMLLSSKMSFDPVQELIVHLFDLSFFSVYHFRGNWRGLFALSQTFQTLERLSNFFVHIDGYSLIWVCIYTSIFVRSFWLRFQQI